MSTTIDLTTMTVKEKQDLLLRLWEDLKDEPEDFPSPPWHAEILAERRAKYEAGLMQFEDLETAKERIRKACL